MIRFALPQSVFGRLTLVFLAFSLVMTVGFLFVNKVSHELYHRELAQSVNRDLAQRYVDADFLLIDQPLTAETLHAGIGKLAAANPDVDIYLIEPDGTLVASSVPEDRWARRSIDPTAIRSFLDGAPAPIIGPDPADAARRDVFSAATVDIPGCPARYLYILLRRGQHAPDAGRLKAAYSITEGAGLLAAAVMLSVGLAVLLLRALTRRLGVLERAMHEFEASGGSSIPPPSTPLGKGDEIDRLEQAFLKLARRSRDQMNALRESDRMRRDLLANVSHDLRTPLTTLVTHLESVTVDGARLAPAERQEYLVVAMRQAQRVIGLVEQLLEAAKLEAGAVTPNPEPFLMCELLQDVVQKFGLVARARGVGLELDGSPGCGWVNADIALIERVLDNLIENALQHAPRDSTVRIRLAETGDAVRVSVVDQGEGLTAAECSRVFERFFRKDRGRSTPAGHAGLGLAIVQGILRLHGTCAWVTSRADQGTEFLFELPRVAPLGHSVDRSA